MKMKWGLLILISAILFYFLFGLPHWDKQDPRSAADFIINSDKDDLYNNILKVEHESDSDFNAIVIEMILAEENMDLMSIGALCRHLNYNKDFRFIDRINAKLKQLELIPADSQWSSHNGYYMNSIHENSSCLKELREFQSTYLKENKQHLPFVD